MPETKLLEEIVELGARLVGARYGALGVMNARGDGLERFITAGIDEESRARIGSLPTGKGILGALIRDPRPLRLANLHADARSVGFPGNHPPMNSFLGVPLQSHGGVYGNFYFTEKEGAPEFSAADERLAENFARLAVQAIENPMAVEEGLRRDLDAFRTALAETGAVIITNPAREIILWNAGAEEMFGIPREDALGRRIEELLVPPEEQVEWRRRYVHEHTRDLRAGRTVRYETTRFHKDGHSLAVTVALSPIRHGSAGIMAVTGVYKIARVDRNGGVPLKNSPQVL